MLNLKMYFLQVEFGSLQLVFFFSRNPWKLHHAEHLSIPFHPSTHKRLARVRCREEKEMSGGGNQNVVVWDDPDGDPTPTLLQLCKRGVRSVLLDTIALRGDPLSRVVVYLENGPHCSKRTMS